MTQIDACVPYNKNMNKKILVIIFIFAMANTVFANDIVQRITYSNGTIVLLCDDNGNIDYCSDKDKQNSINLLNNPNISVVEQITLKQQPDKKDFNKKCYNAQRKIQSGANLTNTILDSARVITNIIGVGW